MRIAKLSILLALPILVLVGCKKQKNWNFQIIGHIDNAPATTYARLYLAEPTGNKLLDSAKIDQKGDYNLRAHTKGENFYILTFTNANYNIYLLPDSGENVIVSANYKDILNTYTVKGSPQSQLIQQLEQHLSNTKKTLDSLTFLYEGYVKQAKTDSAKKIDSVIKKTMQQQKAYSTAFVLKHKNSLVALPALSQVYIPGKGIFDPDNDAQIYFIVDSALSVSHPHNLHVLRLHNFVQNIKLNKRRHQFSTNNIYPGAQAPQFSAKTIDNKQISLSGLHGKRVYILFTASWCNSCKQTAKRVGKIQGKDLVKIAIMLDINQDSAQAYASKYLPGFLVICDHRFWNSPIVRLYHVTRLPWEILINKNGKIIGVGKEADKKL